MRRDGDLTKLELYDDEGNLNVIVDTPKGSHNKFKYDPKLGLFKVGHILPVGATFPFDFGFLPSTRGGDGDPLDVVILMDAPAFPGCLVGTRLIGVIEATQTESGTSEKNDRLVGVAVKSRPHADIATLNDLDENLLDELEHFFISYNEIKGKRFKPTGRFGPERAEELAREGMKTFKTAKARRAKPRKR
jgi:inorganic pyrophosphatase